MSEVAYEAIGEIVGSQPFFYPVDSDAVDSLTCQYQSERTKIERMAAVIEEEYQPVAHYFVEGNIEKRHAPPSIDRLFKLDGAVAALNAAYWNRALQMTDVLDCMPQKRRDEWFELIRSHKTPDFDEETVRSTLGSLLMQRSKYFAERVDGIFRSLSHEHVTNRPEGFSKRMILSHVINDWGGYGHSQIGVINDLRNVIGKFMGRAEEYKWNSMDRIIDACRRQRGQWMQVDGNAMKIRVYKKGTAHLEVHPEMACRLNGVLASLYPGAIPSRFRKPPKRKPREVKLMDRPLPSSVLAILGGMRPPRYGSTSGYKIPFNADKHVRREVIAVMESIGGVREGEEFKFDYDPGDVVDEIICSGCIPDDRSHQYYPTPEWLAEIAVNELKAEAGMSVLEPSAGGGSLLEQIPVSCAVTAVEVSDLRCKILREKHSPWPVLCGDFLQLHPTMQRVDRVIMNPPFDHRRWMAHLDAAAELVKPGGRLVAILPSGARKHVLHDFDCKWSQDYHNAFPGASVSVAILTADRQGAA